MDWGGQIRINVVNTAGVAHLNRQPLMGTWYRAIQLQYWNTLLQTVHTKIYPSRL